MMERSDSEFAPAVPWYVWGGMIVIFLGLFLWGLSFTINKHEKDTAKEKYHISYVNSGEYATSYDQVNANCILTHPDETRICGTYAIEKLK